MKNQTVKFSTVEAYLASFPAETQKILQELRTLVKTLAPEAEEHISYNMPAFRARGRDFFHFSAWEKHLGIYPLPAGDETFQLEIAPYRSGKSSLHFSLSQPLPRPLMEKIIRFRLAETLSGAKK